MRSRKMRLTMWIVLLTLVWSVSPILPDNTASAHFRYYENVDQADFPQQLQDNLQQHPWQEGFLDVTKAPYNAAGDGVTDDSDALQAAIDDAYGNNLVVYLPEGTYLVSKQLRLEQIADWTYHPGSPFGSQRKFGHLIVGSTTGVNRPVIKLADHSTVKDNILLQFRWYDPANDTTAAERHYLATFRGIDVDMGVNPDVSAISMAGAQLCAIEDVDISGQDFHAGIYNLPGSGGSVVNVKVFGGKIGIYQNQYRPTPLVVGVHLENQSQYGIDVRETRGALIVAGFKIVSPSTPATSYRSVYVRSISTGASDVSHANLTMADGQIEVKGGTGRAIYNFDQNVTLHNVYMKAHVLIESGVRNAPSEFVFGNSAQWKRIPEYFFSTGSDLGHIRIDGVEQANTSADYFTMPPMEDEEPSEDLIAKHIWGEMPSWQETDKLNIRDYGATPEQASDDDAPAVQAAIDEAADSSHANYGKTVFIPRGHFHIRSPIILKPGVKLIGAGKNISVLQISTEWEVQAPTTALDSVDDPQGKVILSDFAILGNKPSFRLGTTSQKNLTLFTLRSGQSLMRDVQFSFVENQDEANRHYRDNVFKEPLIVFTGNAGGSIYNLVADMSTTAEQGSIEEKFRYVLIDGVTNPLSFYYFDIEHAYHSPQSEIRDSNQVSIYAFKYEFYDELMRIGNSRDVQIYGGSGNYSITNPNDEAIFAIENSADVGMYNMARKAHSSHELPDALWVVNGADRLPDDHPIVAYRHSGNLAANGSMEQDGADWQPMGSANLAYSAAGAYQGRRSLHVSGGAQAGDGARQEVTAALNEQGPGLYRAEAWIRNASMDSSASIQLVLTQGGVQQSYELAAGQTAAADWIRIAGEAALDWTGLLEYAELRIQQTNPSESYALDFVYLTRRPVVAPLANLLANGDFENGLLGWSPFGEVALSANTDIVYSADAALKISGRDHNFEGVQQDLKAQLQQYGPGAYTFDAWVKNEGPVGYNAQNGLEQLPSEISAKLRLKYDGKTQIYTIARLAEDYRWKKLSGTVNMTWQGELDEAIIYFTNSEPTWNYYIDKASLTMPSALAAAPDLTQLQAKIAEITAAIADGTIAEQHYTPASWLALQTALADAELTLALHDAAQPLIDAAMRALQQVYLALDTGETTPAAYMTGPGAVLVGQPFELSLAASGLQGLTTLTVEIAYDRSKLLFATEMTAEPGAEEGAEAHYVLAQSAYTVTNAALQVMATGVKPEQGMLLLVLASDGAAAEDGALLQLHGEVLEEAEPGNTSVTVTGMTGANADEEVSLAVDEAVVVMTIQLADKAALDSVVGEAEQLLANASVGGQPGQYPQTAVNRLVAAVQAAEAVLMDAAATTAEVHAAVLALQQEMAVFRQAVVPAPQPEPANKTELIGAIAAAQKLHNAAEEGSKIGQYTGSQAVLQQAIEAAEAVRANTAATQAAVNAATEALDDAVLAFAATRVTLVPGASQITLRDLAIIAKYYGATSGDDNWSEIEKADLYGEGITLQVMAAVAQMIVDDWLAEERR